jgi:transposase
VATSISRPRWSPAAACASRQKGSYYKDEYHRLRVRRGRLRAAMAIAHKILIAAYHMLAGGVPYRELGEAFLDQQARQRTVRHLLHRLNQLGYDVMLQPRAA